MSNESERGDIAGLYFIVGGLVVFAVVLGFLFLGNTTPGSQLDTMSPAAGDRYSVDEGDTNYYIEDKSKPPRANDSCAAEPAE